MVILDFDSVEPAKAFARSGLSSEALIYFKTNRMMIYWGSLVPVALQSRSSKLFRAIAMRNMRHVSYRKVSPQ
jgi:hypothetical protein